MLQSPVLSQLARIKIGHGILLFSDVKKGVKKLSTHMNIRYMNPMAFYKRAAEESTVLLGPNAKHWFAGGVRSSALAINALQKAEIIAVPTDTIYGFAVLAQNNEALDKLYEIKGRERSKPFAVAVSDIRNIEEWAEVDHLPRGLLYDLLPGPVTVVLRRKPTLNPALNPGHATVGIRIPQSKFIQHICEAVGQPLALTSANLSNQRNTLHPDEFEPLWPKLAAIYYGRRKPPLDDDSLRVGSTVVDLTVPGEYEILREGLSFDRDIEILKRYGVRREANVKEKSEEITPEHRD